MNRRVDSILFALLLLAPLVAYWLSTGSKSAPPARLEIPVFGSELALPPVVLPEPSFVFRGVTRDEGPGVRRPVFDDQMESALREVRTALLASSLPGEVVPAD